MTYVAIQAYGDGDENETIIESGDPAIAQPTNLTASIHESNIKIEFNYASPVGDVKEGFLIYAGLSEIPDWNTAIDIANEGSNGEFPNEHISTMIPNIEGDLIYIAVRAYGLGLTSDSAVISLSKETQTIKNVSLYLSRFGNNIDYKCTVYVFKANEFGMPEGAPLGVAERSAADIGHAKYYNFLFDPVIETTETNLVITFQQNINDGNNYVIWHNSDILKTPEDFTIDSNVEIGDSYAYGSSYTYGYGEDISGPDFYDVIGIYSSNIGYIHSGDYGFEQTLWKSDQYVERCFKVYDRFNELTFNNNSSFFEIPSGVEKSIEFSNRQEFYDGFKDNVDILDNKVTLKDIGKRIAFYDTNDPQPKWKGTNRNLPAKLNDFAIVKGSGPYNAICAAACPTGLFYSLNSGGDWTEIEEFKNINVLSVAFYDSGSTSMNSVGSIRLACMIDEDGSYRLHLLENESSTAFGTSDTTDFVITSKPLCMLYFGTEVVVGTEQNLYYSISSFGEDEVVETNNAAVNNIYFIDDLFIAATDDGIYTISADKLTVTKIAGTDAEGGVNAYCLYKDMHYIGTDNGLFVTNAATLSATTALIGNDVATTPYLTNLKKTKITGLVKSTNSKSGEDETLYLSQDGGVAKTTTGINFITIVEELNPDLDVRRIVLNPSDSRLVHILTDTTKNKTPYVTFVVDVSGSMHGRTDSTRTQATPEKDQYELLAQIGQQINDSYIESNEGEGVDSSTASEPGMRFELITFATSQNDMLEKQALSNVNMVGAENITHGFTLWSVPGNPAYYEEYLRDLFPKSNFYTPLYETLWATIKGMYNEGSDWYYQLNNKYKHDAYEDELFRKSSRVIIILTDGRDTNSFKTIEDILEDANHSIKNLDAKIYYIAYGEQANLHLFRKIRNKNTEVLYARAGNEEDFSTINDYIIEKEGNRRREGIYKKSFSSKDIVYFNNAEFDINVSDKTSIEVSYRISNNRYDLGDFTDYEPAFTNGINALNIAKSGRFIEFKFRLISDDVNDSPSINKLTLNYTEASESTIVMKALDNSSEGRMDSMAVSTNIKFFQGVYGGGYDYYHYLKQSNIAIPLDVQARFSPTNSIHPEIFEVIQLDKRSIVDRRTDERTTTEDYIVYDALNGAWDSSQNIIVYLNGTELDPAEYFISSSKGQVIFPIQLKTSDVVTLTVEPLAQYRVAFELRNLGQETVAEFDDFAMQYATESSSQDSRPALPLVASQLSTGGAGVTQVRSNVSGYPNSAIAGENAFITVTYIVKEDLLIGSYLLFALGDFLTTPDDVQYFKLHEGSNIFGEFEFNPPTATNYFGVSSSNDRVRFALTRTDDNMVLIKTEGDKLIKNSQIFFSLGGSSVQVGGFYTGINTESPTDHTTENGTVGALTSYPAIAALPRQSSTLTEEDLIPLLKPSEPAIVYSAINEVPIINFVVPTTTQSRIFSGFLAITNAKGIPCTTYSDVFTIKVLDLATSQYVGTDSTVTMTAKDNGTKRFLISVPVNGLYQIVVQDSVLNSKISNVIHVGATTHILWGDLNAKSILGDGRQSPNFVFQYARDIAGLDFCGIADVSTSMSEDDWLNLQKITTQINVDGEFCSFIAVEWRPDFSDVGVGQKTILFAGENVPLIEKLQTTSLDTMYSEISLYPSITFAQHPAYSETDTVTKNYNVNYATIKDRLDLDKEKAIELYSEHGSSEANSQYIGSNQSALRVSAGIDSNSYYIDALYLGLKMSALGNSNGACSRPGLYAGELNRGDVTNLPSTEADSSCINNRGLTAVITGNFNRNSIFEAIAAGKTYATTGAKIYVDFKLGSAILGDTVIARETNIGGNRKLMQDPTFSITVRPCGNQDAIFQLIRIVPGHEKFKIVYTGTASTTSQAAAFVDTELVDIRQNACYYLRVLQKDRHFAWTSPIYVEYVRAT